MNCRAQSTAPREQSRLAEKRPCCGGPARPWFSSHSSRRRLARGSFQRARVGIDQLGLIKKGCITSVRACPVGRVRRNDEVASPPEVECAPRMEKDLLSRLHAQHGGTPTGNRPRRRLEKSSIIRTSGLTLVGQDVAEVVEQAKAGLKRVNLPVNKLAQALGELVVDQPIGTHAARR